MAMEKSQPPPAPADVEAFQRLIAEGGPYTKATIAKLLGVTRQAVSRWETIPLKYVTLFHQKTGIPKAEIRPSDFA